jgi:hypothetical protein
MYNFLIEPIRAADRTSGQGGGNLFVKRFLSGPQKIWDQTQRRGFEARDLWDIDKIADEHLRYLKNIVGWTDEPTQKAITDRLSFDQLRKLIRSSIALWRIRGSEEAYKTIVRLVTNARIRVWSWFDYRYLVEETAFGEDRQGRDPSLIPVDDETMSDIRIVDNGTLDRELIRLMVNFFKPGGEKVTIYWIDFLDMFTTDGDESQWTSVESGAPTVVGGTYQLIDDGVVEESVISVNDSEEWTDYLVYFRARFTQTSGVSSVRFFYLDSTNYYRLEFDVSSNEMELSVVVAGSTTSLSTYSFSTHSQTLVDDVYYGVRVVCENLSVPTDTTISVWVDGSERINVATSVASRQTKGKISIRHEANATIEVSEVELFQIPMDSNLIGLNGEIS